VAQRRRLAIDRRALAEFAGPTRRQAAEFMQWSARALGVKIHVSTMGIGVDRGGIDTNADDPQLRSYPPPPRSGPPA
jgi:hypothetical protein